MATVLEDTAKSIMIQETSLSFFVAIPCVFLYHTLSHEKINVLYVEMTYCAKGNGSRENKTNGNRSCCTGKLESIPYTRDGI